MDFAPITGAWIETSMAALALKHQDSHPSRVRGLKQADL